MQRKNAEVLSFCPTQVFERELANERIHIAWFNNEPCGYIYHGAFGQKLKIHQACIQYDLRGKLYGAALIGDLLNRLDGMNVASIHLNCGSDIEANSFWRHMGFYCEQVRAGGVRRMRDINCWRYDLQQPLFAIEVDPSSNAQDASVWRQRDKTIKRSQFIRGKRMDEYRSIVTDEQFGAK